MLIKIKFMNNMQIFFHFVNLKIFFNNKKIYEENIGASGGIRNHVALIKRQEHKPLCHRCI